MANALLGSLIDIIPAIVPLDLQTQRTGDVMSTKGMARFGVLVFKGAGTAGDDPVLSFKQATDVAGATNKDLAVITEYWSKQGTLTSVGTWTRVTQAASGKTKQPFGILALREQVHQRKRHHMRQVAHRRENFVVLARLQAHDIRAACLPRGAHRAHGFG